MGLRVWGLGVWGFGVWGFRLGVWGVSTSTPPPLQVSLSRVSPGAQGAAGFKSKGPRVLAFPTGQSSSISVSGECCRTVAKVAAGWASAAERDSV